MDILQKQDLAAASFANDNTNAAGGIAIRTDAGSTVGAAITAATPAAQTLSIAGQTLSLSGGGGSVAVPSTAFATPAETVAGLVTGKAVDPAGLTAKLANQPAAGACTDREDVVWNGTILQGAAKHYSFSGSLANLSTNPAAGDIYLSGAAGRSESYTVITNPSSCRTLRVTVIDLAGRLESSALTNPTQLNQIVGVEAGGMQVAVTVAGTLASVFVGEPWASSGSCGAGYGAATGYYDLAPSASVMFTLFEQINAGQITFNNSGIHGASAGFIAQTI